MQTQAIIVVQASEFNKVAPCFYKPRVPKGFYSLGTAFSSGNSKALKNAVFCAKPGSDEYALKYPTNYTLIGRSEDVMIWKPVPPKGYVALGAVAVHRNLKGKPSVNECMCVKQCYVVPGRVKDNLRATVGDKMLGTIEPSDSNWKGLEVGTFDIKNGSQSYCIGSEHISGPGAPSFKELHKMIKAFGPIHKSHQDEDYFPTSVDWFVSQCKLSNQETGEVWKHVGVDDLPSRDHSWPYELILEDPSTARKGDFSSVKSYVHVETVDAVYTDVNFSIFYAFTGPVTAIATSSWPKLKTEAIQTGQKEGDWQHVTLRFNNFDTSKPTSVYFAQQDAGEWISFADCQKEGDKVLVYSSLHDHTPFSCSGEQQRTYQQWDENGEEVTVEVVSHTSAEASAVLRCSKKYEIVTVDYLTFPQFSAPAWLPYVGQSGIESCTADLNMSHVDEYEPLNSPVGPWAQFPMPFVSIGSSESSGSTVTMETTDKFLAHILRESRQFKRRSTIGSILTDISDVDSAEILKTEGDDNRDPSWVPHDRAEVSRE